MLQESFLFNFGTREIEILKNMPSKYGFQGNVKSRAQQHVMSNCCQITFRNVNKNIFSLSRQKNKIIQPGL